MAQQGFAQSHAELVRAWQEHYKKEFFADPRSPLKAADTGFLRFFAANDSWDKQAAVTLTPDAKPFEIATHNGSKKLYRQFAVLTFDEGGKAPWKLCVYESVKPMADTAYRDFLFLPFNDLTNYETTYAGGRYIDLRKRDITHGRIEVDFNKAYNPYCAFGEGYACPIPPAENKLAFKIEAGEQLFAKPAKD